MSSRRRNHETAACWNDISSRERHDWSAEYIALCNDWGVDPAIGLARGEFVKLVNDTSDGGRHSYDFLVLATGSSYTPPVKSPALVPAERSRGLAEAVLKGTLDTVRLAELDDDAVAKAITEIRGLGKWSADIYMLFALDRADAWPLDDLAIQIAAQKLKRMRKRPDRKRMETVARRWRPYRGVVALFLWHYYKGAPT